MVQITAEHMTKLAAFYLLILSFIFVSCGPSKDKPKADKKYCSNSYKAQSGETYYWRKLPIQFVVHSDFPEHLRPAIDKAAATWNKALGKTLIVIDKAPTSTKPLLGDNQNTIYWEKSWTKQFLERLMKHGYTHLRTRADEITEADIYIDGVTSFSLDPNWFQTDLQTVLIHEMGHALGLDHSSDKKSVMFEALGLGEKFREIPQQETSALECIYGG